MNAEERFKENQLIYQAIKLCHGHYIIEIGRAVRHPKGEWLGVITDRSEFITGIDDHWKETPQLAAKHLIEALTDSFKRDTKPLEDIANGL